MRTVEVRVSFCESNYPLSLIVLQARGGILGGDLSTDNPLSARRESDAKAGCAFAAPICSKTRASHVKYKSLVDNVPA